MSSEPTAEALSAYAKYETEHRLGDPPRRRKARGARSKTANVPTSEVLRTALRSSSEKMRGINDADPRFRWHVLGHTRSEEAVGLDSPDTSSSSPPDETHVEQKAPTPLPTDLYSNLMSDGFLLREVTRAIQSRIEEAIGCHAKIVIGGSTGMRLECTAYAKHDAARIRSVFPMSDIDIDVYVASESARDAAIDAVDLACSDIVRSGKFVEKCTVSLPNQLTLDNCRTNSRVYAFNTGGVPVSVDVPSLSDSTPRMRHSAIFVTRNDTLQAHVLHRIRLALRKCAPGTVEAKQVGALPRSFPLVDIKTRVGLPPTTVERRIAGARLRVPDGRACVTELRRLLDRSYTDVDASKDGMRRKQLAYFEARSLTC